MGTSWRDLFRNMPREMVDEPARTEGVLPDDVLGLAVLRNGPGVIERFGERAVHWFDAQGVVTRMRFGRDGARATARIVRTEAFEREERAGRHLHGAYKRRPRRPWLDFVLGRAGMPANIGVLQHRDAIYATADSGLPVALDPRTLATRGPFRPHGVTTSAITAHERRVPSRGAEYACGIAYGKDAKLELLEIPRDAPIRVLTTFTITGSTLVHDLFVTERHAVLPLAPYDLSLGRVLSGHRIDAFEFRRDRAVRLAVVPLDAPAERFEVELPACVVEHSVAAHDDGDTLVLTYTRYADPEAREQFVDGLVAGNARGPLAGRVERARVDRRTKRVVVETVVDRCLEFVRTVPGAGPRKVGWGLGFKDAGSRELFDALVEVDLESGAVEPWPLEHGQFASEPQLVQKRDASGPRDAWLLTTLWDVRDGSCAEVVFDAARRGEPPVFRAHYPVAISPRTHGIVAKDLVGDA